MSDAPVFAGIDGGGTKTTLALADDEGRELARRVGPAGLVDPRHPAATADMLATLVREALAEAGIVEKPVALCAGLAGVGNERERREVEAALAASGVAGRVRIVTDGEIALDGALGGRAGVMIIAGTGSVAYARGEDGRVERCGGWGMVVGDEGSAWSIGRNGLAAALRAADGRGAGTSLLPHFLQLLGLDGPSGIPPWAGRSEKAAVAALAVHVIEAAERGDAVALGVVEREARELARHAVALARRMAPWSGPVPVVFHGGVLGVDFYADVVKRALDDDEQDFEVRPAVSDAVAGALSYARRMLEGAGRA
ncbi:N-acetylglucosamine kinase [Longimicrobium sp.]|uniref:N-acetylglucosamine kinase n=1 Tax=Longimicrobium sp. TaxID=2029185 RepID=UPI002C5E17E7|nr:BadF/BadG/BcrA/BcrD ATPase family protein [Longimicrobium sp.]HSU17019.1 BadF/BadG/BcrA/BcrD ATPase family protein [Longimicrobium sp.]